MGGVKPSNAFRKVSPNGFSSRDARLFFRIPDDVTLAVSEMNEEDLDTNYDPLEGEDEPETGYRTPEEPEDLLKFIMSTIGILIQKVIPDKPRELTLKRAGKCLRILGKIWNLSEYPPINLMGQICDDPERKLMDMEGYVDEYQYLHIEAVDLSLTDVKILPKHFVWLLSADLTGNLLTNVTACPLTKLPNLVALKLNRNRVEDPYLPLMKHLQYLGLNSNKIKSLHRIYHPNLETLDLNYNQIKKVDPEDCWKHTKLYQLELRGNQLKTTSGIEYSSLVILYLAENQITELKGLEILVNLQRLHMRDNPLSDLSGFSKSNINLKYLNVRKCHLGTVTDLEALSVLKGLKELIVKGNLFNPEPEKIKKGDEDDDDDDDDDDDEEEDAVEDQDEELDMDEEEVDETRVQILFYVPTLTRIDKKLVTTEERQKLRDLMDGLEGQSK